MKSHFVMNGNIQIHKYIVRELRPQLCCNVATTAVALMQWCNVTTFKWLWGADQQTSSNNLSVCTCGQLGNIQDLVSASLLPLAVGGHLDVVQLLVAHKADIDSQDNRRVSSLMTAFRKGHIKVVKWLVKHVSQFPSDQECGRFIATVSDKVSLTKANDNASKSYLISCSYDNAQWGCHVRCLNSNCCLVPSFL